MAIKKSSASKSKSSSKISSKSSRQKAGTQKQGAKKSVKPGFKKPQKVDAKLFLNQLNALVNENKHDEALAFLDSASGLLKWQDLHFRSIILHKNKNIEGAIECLLQALREPDCKPIIYKSVGLMYVMQGKLAAALPFLSTAYEKLKGTKDFDLKLVQCYFNCLLDVSKTEKVLELSDEVEKIFPGDRAIRVSKASALRSVGKREESLKLLDELVTEFPDEPIIFRIKADVLGDTDPIAALPVYEKALQLSVERHKKPDPAIQWNMSLHLLRVREIARGWECWEQGFHPAVGTMGRNMPHRIKSLKRADNSEVEVDPEKWTIVISEQGIGDQILFLSVMNEAIKEFKKILYIAESRMHPILQRSFPNLIIAGAGMTYHWENCPLKKNGYIPLGSLPKRYRPDVKSFEKHRVPFLLADREKYTRYRNILKEKAGGRPIIGISWKGGYWAIQRKTKQLELENWLPIFDKEAMYVNLQYGDISKEVKYLKERKQEIYFFQKLDFKRDLDDWLAIAGACDGIISVSTALVHFAGAIGQKVAVVMPSTFGPWHLGMSDEQSLAYKNVRIYRPTANEPIDEVINRVSNLIIK